MKTALRIISSRGLGFFLLAGLSAAYLYFSRGEDPFGRWTAFLTGNPIGIFAYVLLIANIAAGGALEVINKLKFPGLSSEIISGMDTFDRVPVSTGLDIASMDIGELVKKLGLRVKGKAQKGLIAQGGRYSFIPGLTLRAGMVLLMGSLLLSAHLRETEEKDMTTGKGVMLLGSEAKIVKLDASLPEEFLEVGEKSTFLLQGVRAEMSFDGKEFEVTPGFPSEVGSRYFRITHMGVVQPIFLRQGSNKADIEAALDVFPPGRAGRVELPTGEAVTFRLEPVRVIKKGLLTGKEYGLKNLLYRVALTGADGKTLGEEVLVPGQSMSLRATEGSAAIYPGNPPAPPFAKGGGIRYISLGEGSFFVRVKAVYDPALVFIYAGLVMALFGAALMPLRFFWYEKRLCSLELDGELLIGYSEEFFSKWAVAKFHRLI